MKILLIFLLLIFPLGQLDRFNYVGSEVVIHINDVAVAITVLGWLFWKRRKAVGLIVKDSLSKPLGIWIAAMLLSLLINIHIYTFHQILISSLYLIRWIVYAGLYFLIKDLSDENKKLVLRLLIVDILIISLSGLIQYLFLPNVAFLSNQDWDDHYYRLIGVFFDPGFTGAILVLGLALGFWHLKDRLERWSVIGLSYSALALTYSRASYLMYLVFFGVLAWMRKSLSIFLLALVILVFTILILPVHSGEGSKLTRENSIFARINNWKQSISIWQSAPVLGVGFDAYRYAQQQRGLIDSRGVAQSHAGAGADSSILLVLATTGLVGLLAYLNLGWKLWKASSINNLFRISLFAVIAHSWFNNTLFYPWVMEWLWIILGLSVNLDRL